MTTCSSVSASSEPRYRPTCESKRTETVQGREEMATCGCAISPLAICSAVNDQKSITTQAEMIWRE